MLINNKIINGILQEYVGKQVQLLGELEIYINQPVGVGEHASIAQEVKKLINKLSDVDSQIETIQRHFTQIEATKDTSDVNPVPDQTAE